MESENKQENKKKRRGEDKKVTKQVCQKTRKWNKKIIIKLQDYEVRNEWNNKII